MLKFFYMRFFLTVILQKQVSFPSADDETISLEVFVAVLVQAGFVMKDAGISLASVP